MTYAFNTLRKPAASPARASPAKHPPVVNRVMSPTVQPPLHAGCTCGGKCPKCQRMQQALGSPLRIGPAGGALERAADRAATRVTNAQAADVSSRSAGESSVARQPRSANAAGATGAATAPASVNQALGSPGKKLASNTRATMESRFAHSFAGVTIHTDAAAAESAKAVNANAYTVSEHIVFDEGKYAPSSQAGQHLLAHELAHVVQQSQTDRPLLQRQEKAFPEIPGTPPTPASEKVSRPSFSIHAQRPDKDSNTGHAWVSVEDGQDKHHGWGFYPACSQCTSESMCSVVELAEIGAGISVDGTVCNDSNSVSKDTGFYYISPEKFEEAMTQIPGEDPGKYNLWSNNCVDYVRTIAALFGITIPDFSGIDEPEELANWIATGHRGGKL